MSQNVFRAVRLVSAGALLLTAVRHVVLALRGDPGVARHWVFVGINVGLAALLVLRPRWAFFPALVLTFQQLWSHGQSLGESFNGSAPLDLPSLAVCLFFPTLVTVLFIERGEDKEREGENAA